MSKRPTSKWYVLLIWLFLFWPGMFIYIFMVESAKRQYDLLEVIKKK